MAGSRSTTNNTMPSNDLRKDVLCLIKHSVVLYGETAITRDMPPDFLEDDVYKRSKNKDEYVATAFSLLTEIEDQAMEAEVLQQLKEVAERNGLRLAPAQPALTTSRL